MSRRPTGVDLRLVIFAFAPLLSGQQATVLETTGQGVVTKVGANPVPAAGSGDLRAMTDAWVQWGQEKGYLV